MSSDDRYDCSEYLDALVTMELSARFAEIDGRKVNESIRNCCKAIRPRINNKLNRNIFDGMSRQLMPLGALSMIRRHLDEEISKK